MLSNIINTVLSLLLVGVIVWLLAFYDETMIFIERLGYGLAGGAVLLSLAKVWSGPFPTPYSDWYQWLWRVAWVMALGGKTFRLRRHRRANVAQKDIAGAYFQGRPIAPADQA